MSKYIDTFGSRYEYSSQNAKELYKVFKRECEKYGILYKMEDIISDYKENYNQTQMSLF